MARQRANGPGYAASLEGPTTALRVAYGGIAKPVPPSFAYCTSWPLLHSYYAITGSKAIFPSPNYFQHQYATFHPSPSESQTAFCGSSPADDVHAYKSALPTSFGRSQSAPESPTIEQKDHSLAPSSVISDPSHPTPENLFDTLPTHLGLYHHAKRSRAVQSMMSSYLRTQPYPRNASPCLDHAQTRWHEARDFGGLGRIEEEFRKRAITLAPKR
ncbi:hypothetical protein V8E53_002596 [Lactarius tabidus]